MKDLVTRSQLAVTSGIAAVFGLMGSAFATVASVEDLWTAFDYSTLNTKVLAALTVFVTINLGYLAYKLIRRTMSKG